jgi:hypothetical protein
MGISTLILRLDTNPIALGLNHPRPRQFTILDYYYYFQKSSGILKLHALEKTPNSSRAFSFFWKSDKLIKGDYT